MKFEFDQAAALMDAAKLRSEPQDLPREDRQAMRRSLRSTSDAVIHEGLMKRSLINIAGNTAEMMLQLAIVLQEAGAVPHESPDNFVYAAKELLEDARAVIDGGLSTQEWEQVRIGAAMLQLVAYGIFGGFGLPYAYVVEEVAKARKEGRPHNVEGLLVLHGILKPATNEGAANDHGATEASADSADAGRTGNEGNGADGAEHAE